MAEGDKLSSVTLSVNGRTYKMACGEGQENHLMGLAAHINERVESIKDEVGQVGDTRLLLMAAIMVADELNEANRRMAGMEAEMQRLTNARETATAQFEEAQESMARTLNAAAQRIEEMAGQIDEDRG